MKNLDMRLDGSQVYEIYDDDDLDGDYGAGSLSGAGDQADTAEPYIDYPDDEVEVHSTFYTFLLFSVKKYTKKPWNFLFKFCSCYEKLIFSILNFLSFIL